MFIWDHFQVKLGYTDWHFIRVQAKTWSLKLLTPALQAHFQRRTLSKKTVFITRISRHVSSSTLNLKQSVQRRTSWISLLLPTWTDFLDYSWAGRDVVWEWSPAKMLPVCSLSSSWHVLFLKTMCYYEQRILLSHRDFVKKTIQTPHGRLASNPERLDKVQGILWRKSQKLK